MDVNLVNYFDAYLKSKIQNNALISNSIYLNFIVTLANHSMLSEEIRVYMSANTYNSITIENDLYSSRISNFSYVLHDEKIYLLMENKEFVDSEKGYAEALICVPINNQGDSFFLSTEKEDYGYEKKRIIVGNKIEISSVKSTKHVYDHIIKKYGNLIDLDIASSSKGLVATEVAIKIISDQYKDTLLGNLPPQLDLTNLLNTINLEFHHLDLMNLLIGYIQSNEKEKITNADLVIKFIDNNLYYLINGENQFDLEEDELEEYTEIQLLDLENKVTKATLNLDSKLSNLICDAYESSSYFPTYKEKIDILYKAININDVIQAYKNLHRSRRIALIRLGGAQQKYWHKILTLCSND